MDPQNPYAVPRADADLQSSPNGLVGLGPQPWEIGEVIGHSWELFKANWGLLLGSAVLSALLVYALEIAVFLGAMPFLDVKNLRPGEPPPPVFWAVYAGVMLLVYLLAAFLWVGQLRIHLGIVRGEPVTIGTMFSGGARYLSFLGTLLLFFLGVELGFLLLLVPGFILLAGIAFSPYFAADAEMGPIAALGESWRATQGQKASVFVLILVLGLLNVAGFLACGLGLLVTVPMSYLAFAIVFTRLTGRLTSAAPEGSVPGLLQG